MSIINQITNSTSKPSEFFGTLFRIRDQIHLIHLKVKGSGSYATHMALNEFYDGLLTFIDDLIESYQGKYGIVNITIQQASASDPVSVIESLAKMVDNGSVRSVFSNDGWILNQLDEIATLCYKTLYKLKNLQ